MPVVEDPPYPAVEAKGWKFEIDHDVIEQSDTWALTPQNLRPWLLMLWLQAWRQSPCGSLPNSDAVIAARIGMSLTEFIDNRDSLMRGWCECTDGRLYHQHITKLVFDMVAKRVKDSERVKAYRKKLIEKQSAKLDENATHDNNNVTRYERVTNNDVTHDSTVVTTLTTDHLPLIKKKEVTKVTSKKILKPDDVDDQVWEDWLKHRKTKKAAVTETVLTQHRAQAALSSVTLGYALAYAIQANWVAFDASYHDTREKGKLQSKINQLGLEKMSFTERDAARAKAEMDYLKNRDRELSERIDGAAQDAITN
jgi:hypothetical protein